MDIKKSFKRFKKNYICESEALDNEEFIDVDLEGSSKTGLDWYREYDELGGTRTAEDIMVHDFDILSKNDWYHTDGSGQVFDHDGYEVEDWDPELEAIDYDEMVNMLGTPEEAVKDDEQPGLTDDDYVDPETMLDSGYDEDFDGVDESCCGCGKKTGKKKGKKSKFVPFWAKKKDLKEALKTLQDAGYSIVNECGADCCIDDDATGFGIAFDDSDYYTEDGECEVCAICGKESCNGEFNEDGDFVCADCAENSLEQPMEEIDPMDIYFRAGRANNIRDMHTFGEE